MGGFYTNDPTVFNTSSTPAGQRMIYKTTLLLAGGVGTHRGILVTPGDRGCWIDYWKFTKNFDGDGVWMCRPNPIPEIGSLGTALVPVANNNTTAIDTVVQPCTWTQGTVPDGYIDDEQATPQSQFSLSVGQMAPGLVPWFVPNGFVVAWVGRDDNENFFGYIGIRE